MGEKKDTTMPQRIFLNPFQPQNLIPSLAQLLIKKKKLHVLGWCKGWQAGAPHPVAFEAEHLRVGLRSGDQQQHREQQDFQHFEFFARKRTRVD